MDKSENAIFTNLCMVYDNNGNILVQDRIKDDWKGIAFPGGHVKKNEPFIISVIREIKEETGLDITNVNLCGIKQWITKNDERYIVLLYKTNFFKGKIKSSNEGDVFWIPINKINEYNFANDFDKILDIFLKDNLNEAFYDIKNNYTLTIY